MLVGVNADSLEPDLRSDDESLDELEALLKTAGGICCAKVLQNRQKPDTRTYIGGGKVAEIKELIESEGCSLVVFDNDLSPSQLRVLTNELDVHVVDRSTLILEIFARRARTREGRLQVELAQYKYLLPRLTGMWKHLESQTGSSQPIGTRGPGETQLETDRRHIRRKIKKLEEELEAVRAVRKTQRRMREKNNIPVAALVGYTNAGKSTLINRITNACVHAEDRLFDTLDTTTRKARVSEACEILVSDTVGFIRKLPHHLIEAFKATLEELKYADTLLHVIDFSNPDWRRQADVVEKLIVQLGAGETPRIDIFNKADLRCGDDLPRGDNIVVISAKTGEGIDKLLETIESVLNMKKKRIKIDLPYAMASLLELLHREGGVLGVDYTDSSILIDAVVNAETYNKVKAYETS